VQLAPFGNLNNKADTERVFYAELREAQLKTMRNVPKTAMAVITDFGNETDIHPKPKEPVGERLARAAEAIAYGRKVEYSGPIFDKAEIKDGKVVLSFTHVGKGLDAKGGPLVGFTVCGEDRKFVKAEAEIKDDKVIVSSKDVPKPVAARYGWANYMAGLNLYNKDGLPASPFRTDDFPLLTDPKTPKAGATE
jgi:sialate O-acetylesterase